MMTRKAELGREGAAQSTGMGQSQESVTHHLIKREIIPKIPVPPGNPSSGKGVGCPLLFVLQECSRKHPQCREK